MASQSLVFDRPIGASADVKELEYIAALHQTDRDLRNDGSIKAIDIVHFLSSRYGIRVSVKEVQETILRGLGGGDDEEECIDLTEVVAILLIPELIKAARALLGEEDDDGRHLSRQDFTSEREFKEHLRRSDISQARTPNPEIIGDVFDMILKDTFGSTSPRKLDRQLITDIFTAFGEEDLVCHGELIDEMMLAASSSTGEYDVEEDGAGAMFDKYSFARALTSDVQDYSVNCETSLTTHYYDVFKTIYSTKQKPVINRSFLPSRLSTSKDDRDGANKSGCDESEGAEPTDHTQGEPENRLRESKVSSEKASSGKLRPVKKVFTFPTIDYVAGTYRSKRFVIALWVCGVATFFAYLYDVEVAFGRIDCTGVTNNIELFGCNIANGIVNWLIIMVELSLLGSIFIIGGSMGNSTFSHSKIALILGMASIAVFTILPFIYDLATPFFDTTKAGDQSYQFLYYMSLLLGCLLLATQGVQLLILMIPKKTLAAKRWLSRMLTPHDIFVESAIKQAASLKVNTMIQNAAAIHQSDDSRTGSMVESSYGLALLNFDKNAEVYERAGGLWWTWTRMWNGTLYSEEGIFLNSQIMAGNTAQIIVGFFIFIAGIAFFVASATAEDVEDDELAPKKWMVLVAALLGVLSGLSAVINMALIYIPSSISTILKFRLGVIPSLRDKKFVNYRYCQDQVALLFGSMFWGSLYTSIAVAFLVGGLVFLAVWQVTSAIFLELLAHIIGLLLTVGLKVLFLLFLRSQFFASFYRKQPAQSNVLIVVLGCWNVALATGYVLVRGLFLLLAAALHIGRLDVPFLAPDVKQFGLGWCSIDLDAYPTIYRKALLSSEAHRHPWIERLGFMYMMKLRHGDGFAKTSGSVWRLLFVFALMPWLRKYRILARPELQDDDEDYSHFKFGKGRMLPRRSNLRRFPGGLASGEDIALDEKDTDSMEEEIKVLKDENEGLKTEIRVLHEEHLRLLQTLGLANANEAKNVAKV